MRKLWDSWRAWRRTQRVLVWVASVTGAVTVAATWVQQHFAAIDGLSVSARILGGMVATVVALWVTIGIVHLYSHFKQAELSEDSGSHLKGSSITAAYTVEQARKHEEAARLAQQERDAIAAERDELAQGIVAKDTLLVRAETESAKKLELVDRALRLVDEFDERFKATLMTIAAIEAMISDEVQYARSGERNTPEDKIINARQIIANYRNRDVLQARRVPIAKLSATQTLYLSPIADMPWDMPRKIIAGMPLDSTSEEHPSPESAS